MKTKNERIKILVYPRDPNPYQELIYSELKSKIKRKYIDNPTSSGTVGLLLLFIQLIYYRIKGYKVFHLHWFYTFYSPFKNRLLNNAITRAIYTSLFLIFISFIKILRYRLIWTVHNVLPLIRQFINVEGVIKILSRLSDSKIVHSETTLKSMEKLGISTRNSFIIPHGNYSSSYPNTLSKGDAMERLDIEKNIFVFCFFGRIESYKGVLELLHDYSSMDSKDTRLIIAGVCNNKNLKEKILKYRSNHNIMLHLEFIQDNNIQVYLNAADIVVYPFKTITTSGSVMLSLSFGKPIIYPKLGNLKDIPENIGFSYEPGNKKGLTGSMKKAIDNRVRLKEMGKNALEYSNNFSWNKIAEKTFEIYKKQFS